MRVLPWGIGALLIAAVGCGPKKTDLCATKLCPQGETCVPADGSCQPSGAGGGGGGEVDSGVGGGQSGGGSGGGEGQGGGAGGGGMGGGITEGDGGTDDGGVVVLPGDNCQSAIDITSQFMPGADGGLVATFEVDLSAASSDAYGACRPTEDHGKDMVYAFALNEARDIIVTASPHASSADPFIYLRRSNCESFTDVACADGQGPGASETIGAFSQPAGTYYLWVDAASLSGSGAQTVTVNLNTPLPAPGNDTCANAFDITPAMGSTSRQVATTTAEAANDTQGSCGGYGNDLVFKLTLASARDVTLSAQGVLNFLPTLYVRRACTDETTEVLGSCQVGAAGPVTATLQNLAAGDYFIFLDTQSSSVQGPVTLQVDLAAPTLPPGNDSCTAPVAILNGVSQQTVQGTTAGAHDDVVSLECEGAGRDVLYAFTTSLAQGFKASLSYADAGVSRATLQLLNASDCLPDGTTQGATPVACARALSSAVPGMLEVSRLAPGSYLLAVDADTELQAPFTLVAELTAAASPTVTSCANPGQLVFNAQRVAQATGNSADAGNSLGQASCAPGDPAEYPDGVYRFVTPASGAADAGFSARVWVQSLNGRELNPLLLVSSGCPGGSGNELACAQGAAPGYVARAVVDGLAPATPYYVWVDAAAVEAPQGPYAVNVLLGAIAANETCAAAQTLPLNTSVTGDTVMAVDDVRGAQDSYEGCATPYDFTAPDLVYAFTATTAGKYVVTLLPEAGYDATVSVLAGCGNASCLGVADNTLEGVAETVTVTAAAGATYYVVVDGYRHEERGGFTLSVSH
ncbi:MAG: hypothetical protein K1X64_15810 [Myxococcaceae bacterium]|nr:hypothetical protein [Myxococcaceae bacterium]